MCKIYNRHFLTADLLVAIAVAIIAVLVLRQYFSYEKIDTTISANKTIIYPVIASISGTLIGFVITGISIIIAFSESDSEKFKLLKNSKHYKDIYDIYFSSIRYLAITFIISLIGIFLSGNWQSPLNINGYLIVKSYESIVLYVAIIASTISLFRIYRCVWALEKIVNLLFVQEQHICSDIKDDISR